MCISSETFDSTSMWILAERYTANARYLVSPINKSCVDKSRKATNTLSCHRISSHAPNAIGRAACSCVIGDSFGSGARLIVFIKYRCNVSLVVLHKRISPVLILGTPDAHQSITKAIPGHTFYRNCGTSHPLSVPPFLLFPTQK